MLNLNSLMLASENPKVLAKFYQEVFQKEADMVDEDDWYGWQVGASFFGIGPHSEVKGKSSEPSRIMYNFETKEVQAEFDRIKQIDGVTVVKEPYDMGGMTIATLADPDGNYFQLMSPWEG